jgi:hypothetical protein
MLQEDKESEETSEDRFDDGKNVVHWLHNRGERAS